MVRLRNIDGAADYEVNLIKKKKNESDTDDSSDESDVSSCSDDSDIESTSESECSDIEVPKIRRSNRKAPELKVRGLSYSGPPSIVNMPPAVVVVEKNEKVTRDSIKIKVIPKWPPKSAIPPIESDLDIVFGDTFCINTDGIVYPKKLKERYVLVKENFNVPKGADNICRDDFFDFKEYTYYAFHNKIKTDKLVYVNSLLSKYYEPDYQLLKGLIPKVMVPIIKFFIKKRQEITEVSGKNTALIRENEIEYLAYIYHKLINTDCLNFDEEAECANKKKILYAIHNLLPDGDLKTDMRRYIDYNKNNQTITIGCAMWMKKNGEKVLDALDDKHENLYHMFMWKCKLHHYLCPHTMTEVVMNLAPMVTNLFVSLKTIYLGKEEYISEKIQFIPRVHVGKIFKEIATESEELYKAMNEIMYLNICRVAKDIVKFGIVGNKSEKIYKIVDRNVAGSFCDKIKQLPKTYLYTNMTYIMLARIKKTLVEKINLMADNPMKINVSDAAIKLMYLYTLYDVSIQTQHIIEQDRNKKVKGDDLAEAINNHVYNETTNVNEIDLLFPTGDDEYEPNLFEIESDDENLNAEIDNEELDYLTKDNDEIPTRDFTSKNHLLCRAYKKMETDTFVLRRSNGTRRSKCFLCNDRSTVSEIVFKYDNVEHAILCCTHCPRILNNGAEDYAKLIVERKKWVKPILFNNKGEIIKQERGSKPSTKVKHNLDNGAFFTIMEKKSKKFEPVKEKTFRKRKTNVDEKAAESSQRKRKAFDSGKCKDDAKKTKCSIDSVIDDVVVGPILEEVEEVVIEPIEEIIPEEPSVLENILNEMKPVDVCDVYNIEYKTSDHYEGIYFSDNTSYYGLILQNDVAFPLHIITTKSTEYETIKLEKIDLNFCALSYDGYFLVSIDGVYYVTVVSEILHVSDMNIVKRFFPEAVILNQEQVLNIGMKNEASKRRHDVIKTHQTAIFNVSTSPIMNPDVFNNVYFDNPTKMDEELSNAFNFLDSQPEICV